MHLLVKGCFSIGMLLTAAHQYTTSVPTQSILQEID